MFKCTPDNLRDEIRAGCESRDRHLERQDELVRQAHGRFYRSDHNARNRTLENHAYEFQRIFGPAIAHGDPRVKMRSLRPSQMDSFGRITMSERVRQLQEAVNAWSVNDSVGNVFLDSTTDFFFSWAVWLITVMDYPGWQGYDAAPMKPSIMKLEDRHFILDSAAKTWDPEQHLGPRFMGHQWKADAEDLLNDPAYRQDQVIAARSDSDVSEYDKGKNRGFSTAPDREEVLCWDIWIPEKDIRMDPDYTGGVPPEAPGYNGTIYTVAANCTTSGVGKNSYFIRDPAPAFVPPWGPYVLCGYMNVKGSPYPLSALVATAEQAEEHNLHADANARDARRYKRVGLHKLQNPADGQTLKSAEHGGFYGVEDPREAQTIESGGVSEMQYRYEQHSGDRVRRVMGITDAIVGNPDKNVTATAESIGDKGSEISLAGMKAQFHRGVKRALKTAAYYMHYGEGVSVSIGRAMPGADIGAGLGEQERFVGGVMSGMENFEFSDMVIDLEPYTIGYIDQSLLQRRMNEAIDRFLKAAPNIESLPFIKWADVFRTMFEPYNIDGADEWINWDMLQQRALQAQQAAQIEASMATPGGSAPSPNGNGDRFTAMGLMREKAASDYSVA